MLPVSYTHLDGSTLDELRQKKEAMMEEIYRVLCICLGEPPKTFDLEVTDKDDKFIRDTNLTGTAFLEKDVYKRQRPCWLPYRCRL